MSERNAEWWAARIVLAERNVPALCEKSTVAILRIQGSATVPLGTGTLLRIADRCFVVTAAHVVRHAYEWASGLAVTGDAGKIVETPSHWLCSPMDSAEPDKGLGDVAVYALTESQTQELEGKEFVRLGDVGLESDLNKGLFRLVGYPQMFCEPSSDETQKVLLGSLTFATTVHRGKPRITDYDPDVHFLLDAIDQNLVDRQGQKASLHGRQQAVVKLTDGLPGISGCGVWRIGNSRTALEEWKQEDAALVGVAISTYSESEVIKVTRWKFVGKLIYAGFPDMRGPLKLQTMVR